jgi:hypothetical protein
MRIGYARCRGLVSQPCPDGEPTHENLLVGEPDRFVVLCASGCGEGSAEQGGSFHGTPSEGYAGGRRDGRMGLAWDPFLLTRNESYSAGSLAPPATPP